MCTITQPTATDRRLTLAAGALVAEVKSPAAFLSFCTETIRMVILYEYEKQHSSPESNPREDYYFTNQLTQLIAQPWFAGGENMINNIASGFKELLDSNDPETFSREITNINMAYAFGLQDYSINIDIYQTQVPVITALTRISQTIDRYEKQQENKKAK